MDSLEELTEIVKRDFVLDLDSIHGLAHWRRVEGYGLYLCEQNGADPMVIRLFALFHDACRVEESFDPGHGRRGADKARSLRNKIPLDEESFQTLCEACEGHTRIIHSQNLTIATCWDSDRLDLDRVGVHPDPDRLNTAQAKTLTKYDWKTRRRLVGL